jgi:hypothetical protein
MAQDATKSALGVETCLLPDPPYRQGAAAPHQFRAPREHGEGPDARRLGGKVARGIAKDP